MDKITEEMRAKLREPLPQEAVSRHPTKTYLSSIKSIYVVERINDVFGLGTWTLKSEVIERVDKFVVVKAVLEIPDYGFYGEAYGGNDNADIGDAYKGATTDGLTKIAAQQLEIGIDVFKGSKPNPSQQTSRSATSATKAKSSSEHWCREHDTAFFKKGKMNSFAHLIEGTDKWCYEHTEKGQSEPEGEKKGEVNGIPKTTDELYAWVAKMMKWKSSQTARSWLVNKMKIEESKIDSDPAGCYHETKALMGW